MRGATARVIQAADPDDGPGAARPEFLAGAAAGEASCLALGDRLNQVSTAFAEVTAGFRRLEEVFTGGETAHLNAAIDEVKSRLDGLVGGLHVEAGHLERLRKLGNGVAERLDVVRDLVRTITALALKSRVEVVTVASTDGEIIRFTHDLVALANEARTTISACEVELACVSQTLKTCEAALTGFGRDYGQRVGQAIADLGGVAEALGGHQQRVEAANATLMQRSLGIEDNVGAVVLSLQIGDSTRQRVEHAAQGLGAVLACEPRPDAGAILVASALACDLVAGARDAYGEAMAQIALALQNLIAESEDMLGFAGLRDGETRDEAKSVLGETRAKLGAALTQGQAAYGEWQRVDTLNMAMAEASGRLSRHAASLSGITSEMAVVGINAVIKAGRVGSTGRGLAVISEQLRSCAGSVAAQLLAVTPELADLIDSAQALSQQLARRREILGDGGRRAADAALATFDEVDDMVRRNTARARQAAERSRNELKAALAQLASSEVAADLDRCAAAMRQAAGDPVLADPPGAEAEADREAVLDGFAQVYTMAAERELHQAFCEELGSNGLRPLVDSYLSESRPGAVP